MSTNAGSSGANPLPDAGKGDQSNKRRFGDSDLAQMAAPHDNELIADHNNVVDEPDQVPDLNNNKPMFDMIDYDKVLLQSDTGLIESLDPRVTENWYAKDTSRVDRTVYHLKGRNDPDSVQAGINTLKSLMEPHYGWDYKLSITFPEASVTAKHRAIAANHMAEANRGVPAAKPAARQEESSTVDQDLESSRPTNLSEKEEHGLGNTR